MGLDKELTLNSGYKIPTVGFGTWQAAPNEVAKAVETALRAGYRHIDAAAIYGNEHEVGQGIKNSGVPRKDIFVTSKLWNNAHRPDQVEKALDKTLSDLGTDYLDLYLVHWPVSFAPGKGSFPRDSEHKIMLEDVPAEDTWAEMEKMVEKGKVRSIGISNFTKEKTADLLKSAKIKPAVNQVEAHPQLQQRELVNYLKAQNIVITAYSPLSHTVPGVEKAIENPTIKSLAEKLGKTPANVLLSWAVQRGTTVIPKSVTPSRIKSNFDVFELPQDVFEEINNLECHLRNNNPIGWGVDVFGESSPEEVSKAVEKDAKEAASK